MLHGTGIFSYIYQKCKRHVGRCSIHGVFGLGIIYQSMKSFFSALKKIVSQDSLLATAKYTKRDTYMEKDKWSAVKMCQNVPMLRVEIGNFFEQGVLDNVTATQKCLLPFRDEVLNISN